MLSAHTEKEKIMTETREPIAYDLKAINRETGIGLWLLRKSINRGQLRAKRVGKAYIVTRENLLSFLAPKSEGGEDLRTPEAVGDK